MVRSVRDDFAGCVPFAGVFRERSTKVIVRLPTANGPERRGCADVAVEDVLRASRDAPALEPHAANTPARPIERTMASAAPMRCAGPSRCTGAMAVHADTARSRFAGG